MQWLQTTLLQYLENWEESVAADSSIPKEEKVYCTLPQQTIEGIRICGMIFLLKNCNSSYTYFYITAHSLPEITQFLLSHERANYILTERFNQDALEIFFGQQRARGHRNDNPSVAQFMENSQALVVQKSLALGGSSSVSTKRRKLELSPLCRPLPKRRCNRNIKFV